MPAPVYCEKHAQVALEAVAKRLKKFDWFVECTGGGWPEEPKRGLCIIVTHKGTVPGDQHLPQFLGVPIAYVQQAPRIRLAVRR